MKNIILTLAALCALAGSVRASSLATVAQDRRVVASGGFFPQINPQGSRLLYSPTEGNKLFMLALDSTERRTLVAQGDGMPGFDARLSATSGKVYYITQQPTAQRMLLRSAHEWDEATGADRVVLGPLHGAVHALQGTRGMAVVGEGRTATGTDTAGVCVWTLGSTLYVLRDGHTTELTPIDDTVGLLWASVNPDGTKILVEAVAKGLYVLDLQGRTLAHTEPLLFPCWLGNNHVVAQTHGNRIVLLKADFTDEQTLTGSNCIQPMVAGDNIVYATKKGAIYWMKLTLFDDIKEVHSDE